MMKFNRTKLILAVAIMLSAGLIRAQSNLQTFTPSVLLQKGQFEFNQFNSLYSQTEVRNSNGDNVALGERQSFLRNTFIVLYGISSSRRMNIGFEANIVTGKYSSPGSSILDIFSVSAGDYKKTMLSSMGPKVKFTPIGDISFLSVQSTLLFPLSNDLENPRFVDHNRVSWITQLFFDKALNEQIRIFLEAGILYRFKKLESHQDFFRIPLSVILSYFPSNNSSIFTTLQHSPVLGKLVAENTSKFGQLRWFTAIGLGIKHQITNNLGLELSYSNFVLSRNDGAGSTINFGIRLIK